MSKNCRLGASSASSVQLDRCTAQLPRQSLAEWGHASRQACVRQEPDLKCSKSSVLALPNQHWSKECLVNELEKAGQWRSVPGLILGKSSATLSSTEEQAQLEWLSRPVGNPLPVHIKPGT